MNLMQMNFLFARKMGFQKIIIFVHSKEGSVTLPILYDSYLIFDTC